MWKVLEVVYKDFDGPAASFQVLVALRRVPNSTGAPATLVAFDSNAFPASTAVQMNSVAFTHLFNFLTGAYFVEAKLTRTIQTAHLDSVALFIVRLRE